MRDKLIKAKVSEDYFCKKEIGNSIKKYREEILQYTRERFADIFGFRYCTLENVERGVSYPNIEFMTELSNSSGRTIYSFIMSNYKLEVSYADRELIGEYPEETQMKILLRTECEKYNILHMYD
nr:hypothetical protein [Lachnospiraceae bacterium]